MSKNKGITLVALIITIIILLILTGVAVNLAINNGGLFEKTQETTEIYGQSAVNEQAILDKAEDEIDKWFNTDAIVNNLQPGNKVNYGPVNGYNGDWRVLYNDGTSVSIISMESVKSITLEGKEGYNDVVSKLKSEAESYMNSLAESARSVGSKPDGTDGRGATRMAWEDNTNFPYIQTYGSDVKAGDSNINTTEEYTISSANEDYTEMQNLGIHNIGQGYWLASRIPNAGSDSTAFNVAYVNLEGNATRTTVYRVRSNSGVNTYPIEHGLRPVITLKSAVKVTGGDGTLGWDIEL